MDFLGLLRDESGSLSISRIQAVGAFLLVVGGQAASLAMHGRFATIPPELLAWAGMSCAQYLGAKAVHRAKGRSAKAPAPETQP